MFTPGFYENCGTLHLLGKGKTSCDLQAYVIRGPGMNYETKLVVTDSHVHGRFSCYRLLYLDQNRRAAITVRAYHRCLHVVSPLELRILRLHLPLPRTTIPYPFHLFAEEHSKEI